MRTLKQTSVLTKKPHRCQACGEKEPAGTRMSYTVAIFDGDFCACYWCAPCMAFMMMHLNPSDLEFGFEYDIWEYDDYRDFRVAYYGKVTKTPAAGG